MLNKTLKPVVPTTTADPDDIPVKYAIHTETEIDWDLINSLANIPAPTTARWQAKLEEEALKRDTVNL